MGPGISINWNGKSEARKLADRKWQRAVYKLERLEARVKQTEPEDFDALMDEIEATQQEVYMAAMEAHTARFNEMQGLTLRDCIRR